MRSMARCDADASSNLVSCSIVNAAPPSVSAWRGCCVRGTLKCPRVSLDTTSKRE
jgi:hypothetical protein